MLPLMISIKLCCPSYPALQKHVYLLRQVNQRHLKLLSSVMSRFLPQESTDAIDYQSQPTAIRSLGRRQFSCLTHPVVKH